MKKYINGALIGLILVILIANAGGYANGAPFLAYVYSNSMDPLIKVNDAFCVLPTKKVKVGDIVMYRPVVLKASYITHRIIGIDENGYITKGDNAPYEDQDSGEPEVTSERIVGKAVTINGKPFIIPGMGRITLYVKEKIGSNSMYLSGLFSLLGFLLLLTGDRFSLKKYKTRRRLRLHHVYKYITIAAVVIIMLTIFLGSRVSQIKYLVSEYPGSLGDQVKVNQKSELLMVVKNNGLIPVWSILEGVDPLSVDKNAVFIAPRSNKIVKIDVSPQRKTGVYKGYVSIYHYPIFLPCKWIVFLHEINSYLAILVNGFMVYLFCFISFHLISRLHGLEEWIPLKAIKDNIIKRRVKRNIGKIIGRRRVR